MKKLKVAVLKGGSSVEREVSFKSAENILKNIDKTKYDIKEIELPKDRSDIGWVTELMKFSPAFVLSALHGGRGENGAVQGLLQCLNIPYAGSKVLSCALCMNKQTAKDLMAFRHIPVVDGEFIPRRADVDMYEQKLALLEYPLIVKPNRGGSSIGISVVNDYEELKNAVDDIRKKYHDDVIAEKFIDGKEVTCTVLQTKDGLRVTSVLDINKPGGIYDYDAKYLGSESAVSFSTLPDYMRKMIESIAVKAFGVLKCSGYGCVDMIVKDEQVYVIEINTLPGMTDRSLIPYGISRMGMTTGEFIDRLIEFEMQKKTR